MRDASLTSKDFDIYNRYFGLFPFGLSETYLYIVPCVRAVRTVQSKTGFSASQRQGPIRFAASCFHWERNGTTLSAHVTVGRGISGVCVYVWRGTYMGW